MPDGVSRRKLLAVVAGGTGVVALTRDDKTGGGGGGGGGGGFETLSVQRDVEIRPVAGGTAVADSDSVSTLGGGLETGDGEKVWLTARHPFDPEFCGGSEDQVIGVSVHQPASDAGVDDAVIGPVSEVGKDAGHNATDWSIVRPDASEEWTSYIMGLGYPQGTTEPSVGDRAVMSGARTGLIGGEIVGTSTAKIFRGCQFFDLLQYRVEDNADTDGNSGSLIGVIDSNGDLQLAGLHIFGDDDGRYALKIGDVIADAGLQVSSAGDKPSSSSAPGVLEAAVVGHDSNQETIDVLVSNPGGEQAEGEVRTVSGDSTVDSSDVSLAAFTRSIETLSTGGNDSIVLETSDVSRAVTLS